MVQTRRVLRPDCLSSLNRPWGEHTWRPRFVLGVSRHAWGLSPEDIPSVDSNDCLCNHVPTSGARKGGTQSDRMLHL